MSDTDGLRRSPLHGSHLKLGARLVPFAGWEMPVQYTGIVEEHRAVRERVGVFDISHMGQFLVSGPDAEVFLNRALTNDIRELDVGHGQYTLMLNEVGGVIDDLIAYRTSEKEYFLVVNASKIDEDWRHLRGLLTEAEAVHMANLSGDTAGLAVQGPRSRQVFERLFGAETAFPPRNAIFIAAEAAGFMWLCGTGYTGEEGFEFFLPASMAEAWFDRIAEAVRQEGGLPCGLGARDTLRLEMGYPLNGNDLSPELTPLQAGLRYFVAMEKGPFVGRDVLEKQNAEGVPSRLTGFRMMGAAPPPRAHYGVWQDGAQIGEVASGGQSPTLGVGIGMAYLPMALAKPGTDLQIEIRGKRYPAQVVKKPFYVKAAAS